jgi:hypothetical protein
MRTLEHVLFFFIRGRKFYVWDRTRSHIFLFAGENSMRGFLSFLSLVKKKGFENRLFEIRKRGYTRRSVLIYIYNI